MARPRSDRGDSGHGESPSRLPVGDARESRENTRFPKTCLNRRLGTVAARSDESLSVGTVMAEADDHAGESPSTQSCSAKTLNFIGMPLEELLELARAGSKEALAAAVESYRNPVLIVL